MRPCPFAVAPVHPPPCEARTFSLALVHPPPCEPRVRALPLPGLRGDLVARVSAAHPGNTAPPVFRGTGSSTAVRSPHFFVGLGSSTAVRTPGAGVALTRATWRSRRGMRSHAKGGAPRRHQPGAARSSRPCRCHWRMAAPASASPACCCAKGSSAVSRRAVLACSECTERPTRAAHLHSVA